MLRFDYGRVVPWVRSEGQGVYAVAGPDSVHLRTPAETHGEDLRTVSGFTVGAGERVPFVLTWTPSYLHRQEPAEAEAALASTVSFWQEWSSRSTAAGRYRDAVQRSLITLKALTFAPSGGIVAAPTTSLPEQIGGSRNWDYRYSWLRDSTWTLQSLLAAGYTEEAVEWRNWLLRAVAGDPADLQIMYSLTGERRLPEAKLSWLAGFEDSSPVRTGNAAAQQLQIDAWGEVLDGLALIRNALTGAKDDSWELQKAIMAQLEKIWDQPDNGIWEMRGPRRHFTHSKVMAWVAADRMVKAVRESGLPGPAQRWAALRERIHREVMARGADPRRKTFVQSYGSDELDASLLLIPRTGFVPWHHPYAIGTIEAIQRELTQDGLVLRYRPERTGDGLTGGEGVFLACSFWLVEALVGAGRRDEAADLFERLLGLRNDVGLLSEEWDPRTGRMLGNSPQAFSHFALVETALELDRGEPLRSDQPIQDSQRR